jgi:hypothetical protein
MPTSDIINVLNIKEIFNYLNDTFNSKITEMTIEIPKNIIDNLNCPIGSLPNITRIVLNKYNNIDNITLSNTDIDNMGIYIANLLEKSSIENINILEKTEEEIYTSINKFKEKNTLINIYEHYTNTILTIKNNIDNKIIQDIFCPLSNYKIIAILENKTSNIHNVFISLKIIYHIISIYSLFLENKPLTNILGDEQLINNLMVRPIIINIIQLPVVKYIQNYIETKINEANKNHIMIDSNIISQVYCNNNNTRIGKVNNFTKVNNILFLNDIISRFNYKTIFNACIINIENNINKNINDHIFSNFFKSNDHKLKIIKNVKNILSEPKDEIIDKLYEEFRRLIINHNEMSGAIFADILCSNLVDFTLESQNIQALGIAIRVSNSIARHILDTGLYIYKNPPIEISEADICRKEYNIYKTSIENDYNLVRKKLDDCYIDKSNYELQIKNTKENNKCNNNIYIILIISISLILCIVIGITIFLGIKLYKNKKIPISKE